MSTLVRPQAAKGFCKAEEYAVEDFSCMFSQTVSSAEAVAKRQHENGDVEGAMLPQMNDDSSEVASCNRIPLNHNLVYSDADSENDDNCARIPWVLNSRRSSGSRKSAIDQTSSQTYHSKAIVRPHVGCLSVRPMCVSVDKQELCSTKSDVRESCGSVPPVQSSKSSPAAFLLTGLRSSSDALDDVPNNLCVRERKSRRNEVEYDHSNCSNPGNLNICSGDSVRNIAPIAAKRDMWRSVVDHAPSPSCSPPESPSRSAPNIPLQPVRRCSVHYFEESNPIHSESDCESNERDASFRQAEPPDELMSQPLKRQRSLSECDRPGLAPDAAVVRDTARDALERRRLENATSSESFHSTNAVADGEQSLVPSRYAHVISFDQVCDHVLRRYRNILSQETVTLVELVLRGLSAGAKALFVRLYRRKSVWHSVDVLERAYRNIDIREAAVELCEKGLLRSTLRLQESTDDAAKRRACKRILRGMCTEELRDICRLLVDGRKFRTQTRAAILAAVLGSIAAEDHSSHRTAICQCAKGSLTMCGEISSRCCCRKRSSRQSLIDGSSLSQNVINAALRQERVRMAQYVRYQFQRVHSLFFFDDGHDSPRIILVNSGRLKIPRYTCSTSCGPFPNVHAFENYERSRQILLDVTVSVDERSWDRALHSGAIAELELHLYVSHRLNATRRETFSACRDCCHESLWHESFYSCSSSVCLSLHARGCGKPVAMCWCERQSEIKQLSHPFFCRFSAIWNYALACWRSVRALEARKEYSAAVQRLYLLLQSKLVPSNTGKCYDRLTVNLTHLGRFGECLDVIVEALERHSGQLYRGDIAAIVSRAFRVHKRLLKCVRKSGTRSEKAGEWSSFEWEKSELHPVIRSASKSLKIDIPVRMFRGNSLPSFRAEACSSTFPGVGTGASKSEDSETRSSGDDKNIRDVGVKSRFIGLSEDSMCVSVEELALQWYRAQSGWLGVHAEGRAVRFIWSLLFWDCAIYASVPDVFQTAYQVAPWDLGTEAFFASRQSSIESRLREIREMSVASLEAEIRASYCDELHRDVHGICVAWNDYSEDDLACIAAGLGGTVVARCCELLCRDYAYWSGGLPDLVLWRWDSTTASCSEQLEFCNQQAEDPAFLSGRRSPRAKLVEVKSQRDALSNKQRAWLAELVEAGCDCEVFKVVEKETERNAARLQECDLDSSQLALLDLDFASAADSG